MIGTSTPIARVLRRQATDAERRLWRELRGSRFMNMKFRRQHPIGRYVADFACVEAKLVVEVDGSQHLDREASQDAERTRVLNARGYRVLRFWNNDVLKHTEAVLERIAEAIAAPHTPGPSPRGLPLTPDPSPRRGEGSKPRFPSPARGRGARGEGGGRSDAR
ncbi:MAG: endonuclease domain-containing protein [Burkholderiales bacterium]